LKEVQKKEFKRNKTPSIGARVS